MKNINRIFFVVLTLVFSFGVLFTQTAKTVKPKKLKSWWNEGFWEKPLNSPDSKKLPLISVKGNVFVKPTGDTIMLRGVSISDPDKLDDQGYWQKYHFMKIKEMGANIVRIPIHPIAWRIRTPDKYLALLDSAVQWCTDFNMYVIIDWHSIGNLKMGLFQDRSYYTTIYETNEFWRKIAFHFQGHNTVAFYEIFNEPTTYFNQLGKISWDEWKKINEDIICMIRAYDKEVIPLVAAFDWAYDLTPLHIDPIAADGIGYVTHPYPHKRSKPWEPKWDEAFGFAASKYPIVATEIGFVLGKEGMADNGEYGHAIINYFEEKNISWLAWVFDPEWMPALISSLDTYKLTESGEFFRDAMQGKIRPLKY